ncbi:hypothetical protein [Methylobacterium sp. Leaf456]|nr:hypothetical protein [Methylobacterium sp. Leaf456]
MSHRSRTAFPWSSALRDMRNDRAQVPQGFLGSRELIGVAVRLNVV